MKLLQLFEYEKLFVNDQFTEDHLDALAKYNEEHGGAYFKLGYKSVQFQQYVGVIQVGDLTIEILPKVGKTAATDNEKAKWQKILLEMLQQCNWMTVHANEKAHLQFKHNSILEAYLELFIRECESLLQLGLIKKYRQTEGNKNTLKGKLIFSKNIQYNVVHQERFYTRHQTYDKNNIYNQILLQALNTIPNITSNPLLNDRLYNLLFSFPELDNVHVTSTTFSNLAFDRKTSAYEEAISMAAMILLNYRPDIQNGQNNVLAILFDMNDLWEEYVYRQLLRFCKPKTRIEPQDYKKIWENENNRTVSKGVKPDIVLQKSPKTLIIDTKWKLPDDDIPSDADLKQMFMYNEYWDNANAILFYPKDSGETTIEPGIFVAGGRVNVAQNNTRHKCGVLKASVLSNGNIKNEPILDSEFGSKIFKKLEEQDLI
jgi:5-methylcytosine-specific restriction enzyme subunit McrC